MTSLTQLRDGVYAWLQPGGESGVANAGVVVDDDGITVIDTLMVRSQWEPFAAAVDDARPAREAHASSRTRTSTTAVARRRSRKTAIFGSQQTSDVLDAAMPIDAYKAFMPAFEDEFDDLEELGTRRVTHIVTGPRSSRRASRCSLPTATPRATSWCSSPTSTCASPATSASSASPRSRSRATPRCGRTMLDAVADLAGVHRSRPRPGRRRGRGARAPGLPARVRRRARATCTRSRPARGTPGSSVSATRSTWSAPPCSRRGDDEIPGSMLEAMGLA